MNELIGHPEFIVFVLILILECMKALFLGTATAFQRGKIGKFLNQEDADWLGGEAIVTDATIPARIARAHRNTLENLVPFFILGLIYLAIDAHSRVAIVYFIGFLVGRFLHTYAYLYKRPMLRRNSYTLAWLVQIVMALHVLVVIIEGYFYGV